MVMPTHLPGAPSSLTESGRLFASPPPVAWTRCLRCSKPTRQDRAVHGFGRDCAERLGLIASTPRVHSGVQYGPDLFAAFEEDDSCDGGTGEPPESFAERSGPPFGCPWVHEPVSG
jgi:hypothetical protein